MNSIMNCSVCNKPLPSDLDNVMFYWGFDLKKHPLIIAHKFDCDPTGAEGWVFSRDAMPFIWTALHFDELQGVENEILLGSTV